jgi:hypothetical protein
MIHVYTLDENVIGRSTLLDDSKGGFTVITVAKPKTNPWFSFLVPKACDDIMHAVKASISTF